MGSISFIFLKVFINIFGVVFHIDFGCYVHRCWSSFWCLFRARRRARARKVHFSKTQFRVVGVGQSRGPGRAAEVENEKRFEIFGAFCRTAFSERFWCVLDHIWGSFAEPFRIIFGIDFRRKKRAHKVAPKPQKRNLEWGRRQWRGRPKAKAC